MTEKTQKQKIDEMYAFWHESDVDGSDNRGHRVDALLTQVDQGRFLVRTTFWLVATLVFVAANFEKVRGFVWR